MQKSQVTNSRPPSSPHSSVRSSVQSSPAFDDRPIGLFDSGIGGLTVLRTLMSGLPQESFVYLGDTARLPYGNKSPETIERYLLQNIECLIAQNVKAVIVACNSASTVLLDGRLKFEVPVYNVIEPGAQAAIASSSTRHIGVLGTSATIAAQAYVKTIAKLDAGCSVSQQACPLLVPLVEEGWEDDPLTNLIVYRYVQPLLQTVDSGGAPIDTLVLGCTHYPALRGAIGRVAGPNIALVDSSETITRVFLDHLRTGALRPSSKASPLKIFTTDVSPGFEKIARRLMRPHAMPYLEQIDLIPLGTGKPARG